MIAYILYTGRVFDELLPQAVYENATRRRFLHVVMKYLIARAFVNMQSWIGRSKFIPLFKINSSVPRLVDIGER